MFKVERVPEDKVGEAGYSSLLTILKNREFGARARIGLEYNEPSKRLYQAGQKPGKTIFVGDDDMTRERVKELVCAEIKRYESLSTICASTGSKRHAAEYADVREALETVYAAYEGKENG